MRRWLYLALGLAAVAAVVGAAARPAGRGPASRAKVADVQLAVHDGFLARGDDDSRLDSLERLPPIDEVPRDLFGLPPVCLSSLPGLAVETAAPIPRNFPADDSVVFGKQKRPRPEPLAERLPQRARLPEPAGAIEAGDERIPPPAAPVLNPHLQASATWQQIKAELAAEYAGVDPHAEVFANDAFPSATACRKCHEQIYDEWAISSHANAAVSPMFHKFEQKINALAQGTLGYFCMRCHAPVATTLEHPRWASIGDGPKVFREGVTCVACHRVVEPYAKANGERRMEMGPLTAPVVGSGDGAGLQGVLARRHEFKVKTDPGDPAPGQLIHQAVIQFEEISHSTFCMSCHQVAVQPGIKLEVVWEQYRHSPAYKQGIRCQDCHMGRVPGKADGFCEAYVAVIGGKPSGPPRRHSNHVFYGPGASIAHPGIFPQNPQADRWTMRDWLLFDWRAGWGTEPFELAWERGEIAACFPPEWQDTDDRRDAREVLEANFARLAIKDELRRQVMENGSHVEGPFFAYGTQHPDGAVIAGRDLKLHYVVANTNSGHNLPTGSLGAQPQLWLNAVLVGPHGRKVWQSGYLDTSGDLADTHSPDVHEGKVPFDRQLFNLQTKFLITNLKGTDREMPLPINIDLDQLPFIRPAPQPVTVLNHPPLIRMEAHSLPPLGLRKAHYRIPAAALATPGVYRLSVRLRSRGEPIYFMRFVDSTPEMIRSMNEKILDVHPYTVAFEVR